MKLKKIPFILGIAVLFSGCLVFSFYPLYTNEDLFANDLLLGKWIDSDSAFWNFKYKVVGDKKNNPQKIDSTCYIMTIIERNDKESISSFEVKVVKLEENYFLDFYLDEYEYKSGKDPNLFDLHLIPVHSFAKLEVKNDSVKIKWFSPDWLEKLIEQNKIRIHHENNGNNILLTAKPKELQKFVIKYVNSEEAFKDGLDADLKRVAND